MTAKTLTPASICKYGNTFIWLFLAVYFFFTPVILIIYYLSDPGLKGRGIPRFAFRIHKSLAPRYEKWAIHRIKSGKAKDLGTDVIAPTEWPVFGSVFYLWANESLQQAWEQDKTLSKVAPKVYAAGSIEAAAALVADPGHASWVRQHWGDDYLHEENVFYRMLLIGGLTSYHKLLGGDKYLDLLRDQVETLSKELDESKYGLLDDYPNQCFPTDVAAAIAAIKRADSLLGTDHSEFIKRSIRGFEGNLLDPTTGLPPYFAGATSGNIDIARGCSNQWGTTWAAEVWPETANKWYANFEKYFWQRRFGAVGFREFLKDDYADEWYIDVDSGPVIAGFGASACAFGVGAARANNRFDNAYQLGAEVIAASAPLPDGTLLTARYLSNAAHAKFTGEACLLFSFTRMPQDKPIVAQNVPLPAAVYWMLGLYIFVGATTVMAAILALRKWEKTASKKVYRFQRAQLILWCILIITGIVLAVRNDLFYGLLLILLAQLLPRFAKKERAQVTSTLPNKT
ncbi:MAG: hypothetical protein JW749_02630 [Sedimentisphaerales bacterium]|nr:hypothetical protein [Sedimentisphaerales bacterium]